MDCQRPRPNNEQAACRLQKFLASCGVGSRRACEDLISRGHVSVNGTVEDRLPLFDLGLADATVNVSKQGVVRVNNVDVTLNATAADTLNTVFGTNAFVGGFPIGTANVLTRALVIESDDDDDDDDGDD